MCHWSLVPSAILCLTRVLFFWVFECEMTSWGNGRGMSRWESLEPKWCLCLPRSPVGLHLAWPCLTGPNEWASLASFIGPGEASIMFDHWRASDIYRCGGARLPCRSSFQATFRRFLSPPQNKKRDSMRSLKGCPLCDLLMCAIP